MSNLDEKPYFKKLINEITEDDFKLMLIGKIITKKSDLFYLISDESGDIGVEIPENFDAFATLKEGNVIKVLGSYVQNSQTVKVDFLEELVAFNFHIYKLGVLSGSALNMRMCRERR